MEEKYDFSKHLLNDEKILWEGKPVPGKGSIPIAGLVFVICFMLLCIGLMIWSIVNKIGDGANGINIDFIAIIIVLLVFFGISMYGLIYYLFIKKHSVADDFYCITNKRALKYESKKDSLVYGYLENYVDIHCDNKKDGYGDLYMGIELDQNNYSDVSQALKDISGLLMHPNPENMPNIVFESIEDPDEVHDIVIEAYKELSKSQEDKFVRDDASEFINK